MDLSGDKGSGCIDPSSRGSSGSITEARGLKSCADCGTTKTPLWRGGPSGPKSLCNACGIRYRKARRESMGLKGDNKKKRREKRTEETTMGLALKLQLLGMETDVFLKQRRSWLQSSRRKLGEEEQAAVLLMALSSGFL